jgi:replicative DNA helicase
MESTAGVRANRVALDRVPPQNLDAERAVLGGVLLDPEAATRAVEIVSPEAFYRPAHGRIFRAMLSLFTRREPIDVMTLSEELGKAGDLEAVGGIAALTDLVDSTPSAANIEHYARIVLDKYILRQLIRASTEIAEDAFAADREADAILDASEQKIFKISESRVSQGFIHIKEILKERFDEIQRVHETRESVTGLPTGFVDLDAYTAGFHPSDLVIVAGRPSMGKTSFALNIAQHVAIAERRAVAVFSLEMSKELLVQRLLCSEAQVDAQKVRRGFTQAKDIERLTNAAALLGDAPVFIDDTPAISTLDMRARSRRLKSEHDIALVIIDYLQLARCSERAENRQQEISSISRSLKALAKELAIPVIALSQLSRAVEARGGDRRPMLSDLRESGAIEQDADLVLFLYRPEFYDPEDPDKQGKAELIIGKQRNGPTGMVPLVFEKTYTRFHSAAPEGVAPRPEVY